MEHTVAITQGLCLAGALLVVPPVLEVAARFLHPSGLSLHGTVVLGWAPCFARLFLKIHIVCQDDVERWFRKAGPRCSPKD